VPIINYGAECTFGAEFMRHKRLAAAEARAEAKAHAAAARAQASKAAADAKERDVVPWLRQLGYNASEARRAAKCCENIPDASLEKRLRVALSCLLVSGPRVLRTASPG